MTSELIGKSGALRAVKRAVSAVLFFAAGGLLFAQNSGFFFGGGGGYALSAFASEDYSWGEWENKFQQSFAGFLFFGWTMGSAELGAHIGIYPKTYYIGTDANNLTSATFTHIPMLVKFGYSGGNNSLAIKPSIFGGMAMDFRQATPELPSSINPNIILNPARAASLDWRIAGGVGIDLSYAFPGDHIALFIGGSYNLLVPLFVAAGDRRLYHYPQFHAGIIIHPFGGVGGGSRARSSGGSRGGGSYGGSARPTFVQSGGGGSYGGSYSSSSYGSGARQGGQNFGDAPPSTDSELLANLRMAEEERRAELRRESDALLAIARDDGRRPAKDDKIKKEMEEHLAQISALKNEVRTQQTELSSVGFLEEADEETLDNLQRATRKVKTIRLGADDATQGSRVDTVYFFPDVSSPMMMYSLPIVDEVGRILQESSDYIVAIRGYSAPAGTMNSQMMISESRARYCAEYLNKNYGISYDRMTIEWYGAQKKSEVMETYKDRGFNRAVELVTRSKSGAHVPPELSNATRYGSPVNVLADDYMIMPGYDAFVDPSIIPSNVPPDYGPPGTGAIKSDPPQPVETGKKKKR